MIVLEGQELAIRDERRRRPIRRVEIVIIFFARLAPRRVRMRGVPVYSIRWPLAAEQFLVGGAGAGVKRTCAREARATIFFNSINIHNLTNAIFTSSKSRY